MAEKAFVWHTDDLGATFEEVPIPEDRLPEVADYRHRMIDTLTTFDEQLLEKYMAGSPDRRRPT